MVQKEKNVHNFFIGVVANYKVEEMLRESIPAPFVKMLLVSQLNFFETTDYRTIYRVVQCKIATFSIFQIFWLS